MRDAQKGSLLTHPTLVRQDAPCPRQGRNSALTLVSHFTSLSTKLAMRGCASLGDARRECSHAVHPTTPEAPPCATSGASSAHACQCSPAGRASVSCGRPRPSATPAGSPVGGSVGPCCAARWAGRRRRSIGRGRSTRSGSPPCGRGVVPRGPCRENSASRRRGSVWTPRGSICAAGPLMGPPSAGPRAPAHGLWGGSTTGLSPASRS